MCRFYKFQAQMPNVVYDNSAGSQKTIGIETILLKESEGRDLQQIITSSHAFALLSVIICIKIHTKCFYMGNNIFVLSEIWSLKLICLIKMLNYQPKRSWEFNSGPLILKLNALSIQPQSLVSYLCLKQSVSCTDTHH